MIAVKKILGIDFGERRIGLALGLCETKLAFPRPPIDTRKSPDPIAAILQLAQDEHADALLIGWPLHPDGHRSEKTDAVEHFAKKIMQQSALPLFRHDEVYSTVIAKERTTHFSTKRKREQKGDLDSAAATVILQEFLELPEEQRQKL